ncbi:MAG: alpha/beta hydrolase [Thermoanaerobaculia bacterium]|nr:alpha/beta hydrolase [Thermoanaerobaculia bacterium]
MTRKWKPYRSPDGTLLDRRLHVLPDLYSPQLDNRRDIVVFMPAARHLAGRTPPAVLYAQDGQNLFDQATSHAGSWRALEAMDALAAHGQHVILVGVANKGRSRFLEYSPLTTRPGQSSRADLYLDFLVDTVAPEVEGRFGLQIPGARRGMIGSSLGGLISLYGGFARPDAFGLCGSLSPSLQIAPERISRFVERSERGPGRIYLDVGTREISRPRRHFNSRHYGANVTQMRNLLRRKGYTKRNLQFLREKRGIHHESAWARRLPGALAFLAG